MLKCHIAAIGKKNRQVCPHQSVAKIACDFRWRSNSPRSAYKIARCVTGFSEKICSRRQARQTVPPSAGKHRASTKRGKSCNRRQNVPPLQSAGKHTVTAKRGKTCHRYRVRENVEPIPRIAKRNGCQN